MGLTWGNGLGEPEERGERGGRKPHMSGGGKDATAGWRGMLQLEETRGITGGREGGPLPGHQEQVLSVIFRWSLLVVRVGEGKYSGYISLALPSLPWREPKLPLHLPSPILRVSERRGCFLAFSPLSLSLHPHTSFTALEALPLQAGPRHPSAPFSSFPSPLASGPGPQFLHPHNLTIPASPPPPPCHICIPTLPPHPGPRTRTHPCTPPPTTRPGSHLGGSAAAAQKAALLQLGSGCCSRLLLLLHLLPSSPRCPRPDPGRCHRRCSCGVQVHRCQPQLSAPTPDP